MVRRLRGLLVAILGALLAMLATPSVSWGQKDGSSGVYDWVSPVYDGQSGTYGTLRGAVISFGNTAATINVQFRRVVNGVTNGTADWSVVAGDPTPMVSGQSGHGYNSPVPSSVPRGVSVTYVAWTYMEMGRVTFTVPGPPPGPVSSLSAAPGNGQVTLSWGAESSATSYKVYQSSSSAGPWSVVASGVQGLTRIVGGLTNGSAYWFGVTAVNAWGEGPSGAVVSSAPEAPPPDNDNDGIPDSSDPDDDNDGRADASDYAPFDPAVQDAPTPPPVAGIDTDFSGIVGSSATVASNLAGTYGPGLVAVVITFAGFIWLWRKIKTAVR